METVSRSCATRRGSLMAIYISIKMTWEAAEGCSKFISNLSVLCSLAFNLLSGKRGHHVAGEHDVLTVVRIQQLVSELGGAFCGGERL